MVSKRLSHEEGHKRKFLCVVDSTTECEKAVLYAERRATNTGGALALLYVYEPEDFQHWLGVEEVMKAEARERADEQLEKYAQFSREHGSIDPELIYREGRTQEQILELVEEDQDIAILVLAAGDGKDGPGPLVASLGAAGSAFTIPVIVVPCEMTFEEIDSVT
ncbi:MAG: universal stress protein [Rhizobiaceae bacterium]|nr:universal stress protein [Rhizobiaceae bacterium]